MIKFTFTTWSLIFWMMETIFFMHNFTYPFSETSWWSCAPWKMCSRGELRTFKYTYNIHLPCYTPLHTLYALVHITICLGTRHYNFTCIGTHHYTLHMPGYTPLHTLHFVLYTTMHHIPWYTLLHCTHPKCPGTHHYTLRTLVDTTGCAESPCTTLKCNIFVNNE